MNPIIHLKNRKLIATNSKFEIYFDQIEDDQQRIVNDFLVVNPKQKFKNFVAGMAILPIFANKMGLVRIYRHAIEDFSWEVPKGFLEKNEEVTVAAQRELEEETGYSCHIEKFQSLGAMTPESGVLSARMQLFVAKECFWKKAPHGDDIGLKEFKFFSNEEFREMVLSSQIQDPATIITYYKYKDISL